MAQTNMAIWGFKTEYSDKIDDISKYICARVVSQERGIYEVVTERGFARAVISGKLRFEAKAMSEYPAVGDFVLVSPEDKPAVIQRILPRKSVFIRKAAGTSVEEQVVAANVDFVFICMSLNNDFNLARLERYLSIAWESGATPIIILTKSDLCVDIEKKKAAVESIAIGVEILVTTSVDKDGYHVIIPYIQKEKTIAFVGSSGVGKSTLINCLLGKECLKTNELRNDDKGRHTTTHRELILLPSGGIVIDTPGMRELGMWDATEGIEKTFSDIEKLSLSCRFSNCTHTKEPDCAVQNALKSGEISQERFVSYLKLRTENAYVQNSDCYLAAKEKKFKEISKKNKNNRKK